MIVAPSILSCDFSKIGKEIETIRRAKFIHVDVMDGHFVPNITIGAPVVAKIDKKDQILDCHLMISDPKKYAIDFKNANADYITFHYEACKDDDEVLDVIRHIKSLGVRVGISVKPGTDITLLKPFFGMVDLVLVMSVEPGFGGQKFMESSLGKIQYLRHEKLKYNYNFLIEVDGGINEETAEKVYEAGCEVVVAGTYVFKSKNRNKVIRYLESLR